MKEIIFGTTNKNKVKRINSLFIKDGYEIKDLVSLNKDIEEPIETANSPIDLAIEKAMYYAKYIEENQIILTQDDTLVFDNVSSEDQPGMHIKGPVIKKYGKFNDELAVEYYTNLAKKYGGSIPITFVYGHAVATIDKKNRNKKIIIGSESKLKARIVDKAYKLEMVPGYFLAALMQVKINGKWKNYNDLTEEQLVSLDKDLYKSISMLIRKINKF